VSTAPYGAWQSPID
nr:RecName: Full=Puromycin-hydrolyzing enzyme [Streptomyces morookaense]